MAKAAKGATARAARVGATAMSKDSASFGGIGSLVQERVGKETGLPLIQCPYCGNATVFEGRSKKENHNQGGVYFKCPRGVGWSPDRCQYFRWQRDYLNQLVEAKVIKFSEMEEEEHGGGGIQAANVCHEQELKLKKLDLQTSVEKLQYFVYVLFVMFVAVSAMFVGYVLK